MARAYPWAKAEAPPLGRDCSRDVTLIYPNAPHRPRRAEASRPPFPDSNAPHGPFSAKANSMDIDDKRDVNGEFLARRLTLVRGEAREVALYQAPKLELVVNAERKLFEAVMANDPRRVSTWLARCGRQRPRPGRADAALRGGIVVEEPGHRGTPDWPRRRRPARDKDGQTPLYAAAAFGDEAHLCVVLDHGAEIDARDAHGRTPLHYAAHLGRGEATTYLVSRGADISLRDHDGRTPLDLLRTTIRLDPQQEYRWAPLERMLGGVVTMKVTEAGPQRGVADWGMLEALQDNDPKRVATWLARCRRQLSKRGRADAAIRGGVIAPAPRIIRLFWAFSPSNPPESPSQEESSFASMLDTLESKSRSDGPPAGPRSIDPLSGSRSFLTVSAVA